MHFAGWASSLSASTGWIDSRAKISHGYSHALGSYVPSGGARTEQEMPVDACVFP
jgi:hypothetical protein